MIVFFFSGAIIVSFNLSVILPFVCYCPFLFLLVVSSAVDLLTVPAPGYEDIRTLPAVDDNTLNVTWRPPKTPNGFISHYNIDVTSNEARSSRRYNVSSVVGRDQYTYLVNSLG